jgi:predicted Zn-dependent protease
VVFPKPLLEHALAAARARVLMDTRTDALHRWQALDGDRVSTTLYDKLASAYSSALASTLLRDWARADGAMAQASALLRSAPAPEPRAEHWLRLLEAETQLARGAAPRAAVALQPLANDHSRPVMIERAEVAIALGPAEGALAARADELQTWVAVHPHDATAWTLLGQTWARLDRPLRAVRADAEARAAIGDMSGAVERLRAGQRMARSGTGAVDFIDVSVIDARLREFEALRKQYAADERQNR